MGKFNSKQLTGMMFLFFAGIALVGCIVTGILLKSANDDVTRYEKLVEEDEKTAKWGEPSEYQDDLWAAQDAFDLFLKIFGAVCAVFLFLIITAGVNFYKGAQMEPSGPVKMEKGKDDGYFKTGANDPYNTQYNNYSSQNLYGTPSGQTGQTSTPQAPQGGQYPPQNLPK